jgi:hypothetical protein
LAALRHLEQPRGAPPTRRSSSTVKRAISTASSTSTAPRRARQEVDENLRAHPSVRARRGDWSRALERYEAALEN